MKAFWKHAASIFFSLLGLALILAVWTAGNPEYGSISALWQEIGVKELITLSFIAFVVSGAFAFSGKEARPSLRASSAAVLAIFILPFIFLIVVIAIRIAQNAN